MNVKLQTVFCRLSNSAFTTTTFMVFVVVGLSGLTGVVATRALGPYQRGLLATAVVWSTVLGSLSTYGLQQTVAYYVAREPHLRKCFTGTSIALATVCGSALAVCGAGSSLVLVSGGAAPPLAISFAALLPTMLAGVCVGAILGLGEYRLWGLLRIVGPALSLVGVIIVVAAGGHTASAVTWVTLVVSVAQLAVLLLVLGRRGLLGAPSKRLVRPLVSYTSRCMASGATWLILLRLDQLYLSVRVTPSLLGIYAVSASFGDVISSLGAPAGQVMLSRASAGGNTAVRLSLPRALLTSVIVAGGGGMIVFITAPLLVQVLFGHKFLLAVPSLRLLMIGAVFVSMSSVLADTLRGLGRPLVPVRAELVGVVTTIILLAVLVPALGILGAAITSAISYAIVAVALGRNLRGEMRKPAAVARPPTSES